MGTTLTGDPRDILGRVTQRVPLRLYPDTFMADPSVSPRRAMRSPLAPAATEEARICRA